MWQSLLVLLYVSIGFGFLYAYDKSDAEHSGFGSFFCFMLWPMLLIGVIVAGLLGAFNERDNAGGDE